MDHKEQYQSYLAQTMSALEHACARFLPEESEVCRAARYSLMGGGKRIRAVLVLSVCDMLGGNMQAAEQFAAAVEMLHCYSLIHDDLPCMDNDDLRRGRPSCHKAFDEATAMLAGDVLLTEAFEAIANAPADADVCVRAAAALSAGAGQPRYGLWTGAGSEVRSAGRYGRAAPADPPQQNGRTDQCGDSDGCCCCKGR